MTNRCEAEGKLHLCTPQLRRYLASFDLSGDAVTNNGLTLENRFQQILIRAILPLIVEEEGVTDLFVKWCSLSQEERERVDAVHGDRYVGRHVHQGAEQAAYSGRNPWPARHDMTLILNRALAVWERIQDTQGAPGFDADAFVFTCDPDLEEELVDAARTLETILHFVAASPPGLHKWETSPWQRTLYHHLRLPTGNNSPEVTSEELLNSETVVEEGDEGAVEQPPATTGPKSAEIEEATADDSIEGELRPDVEDLEDNSTHSLPDDRGAIADVIEEAMSIMAQISEPLVVEERVHPSSATPPTAGTTSVEEPLPGRPAAVEERDHPPSATPPTAGTTFVEEPLQGMALIRNISPREGTDHPSSATPPATESTFVEELLPGMALRQSAAVEERDHSSSATPPTAGTTFVEEPLQGMALIRNISPREERDHPSSATPPATEGTFVEESLPGMALRQSAAVEERDHSSSATPPTAGTTFVEEPLQGMALIRNISPREERDHPSSATPPATEGTFVEESLPGMALRQSAAVEERDHSSSATPPTAGTTFVEEPLQGMALIRNISPREERDHPSSATPPATEGTFVEESLPGMALRQSAAVEERDHSSSATPPTAGTTFVEEPLQGMALIRNISPREERDHPSSATPPATESTFVEESLPGMALRQSAAVEERDHSSSATPPTAGTTFVEEPLQGMALIRNISPREERDHPSSATPPATESTFVEESLPSMVLRPSAAVEERDHPSSATLLNPVVKLVEEPETSSEKLPGDIHHAKEASSIKLHVAVCILERIEERSMTAIFDDELGCVRQGLVTSQSGQSGDAGDLCSALPPGTLSSVVVDREISSTALHAEGLRPLVLRSSDVEGRDQPSSAERLTIKPDSAENKREDLSDPSPNARDIDDSERPVPQAVIKSEAISLSSNFEEDQTRIGNAAPSVPSARCAEEEADGTETLGRGASPCQRHGGSSTTGGMGLQDVGVQDVGDPSAGIRREDIGAASARQTFEKSPSGLLLPGDEDDVPDTTAKL